MENMEKKSKGQNYRTAQEPRTWGKISEQKGKLMRLE